MATITSANSVFALSITNLYLSPQLLQGYAADDAFTTDAPDIVETVMGVDGHLSAGYIFNPVNMTISIMPDSPSIVLFENWTQTMKTTREVLSGNATIQLPAIRRKYTLTNGYLVNSKVIPDVKRTLQPAQFVVRWEKITGEAF